MILNLDTERLRTLAEVRAFLDGSDPVDFRLADRDDAYAFARRTLVRFRYPELDKPAKGLLRRFLGKVTGLSRAQLTRLIGQYRATGRIEDRRRGPARPFERRYTAADVRQLAEADEILGDLCGAATRRVMQRQFEIFGDPRYERLAGLSNGHLYRLRGSTTYRRRRTSLAKTRPVRIAIGERRKPHPGGRPGFLRVDSVHQGDLDGEKGIHLINVVDEVTQYEFVGAVEAISEAFLLPVLEALIDAFPFRIMGFHTDNASRRDAPARSTSTTASPSCSTSSTSRSSPSRARGTPTTTPSSRARTAPSSGTISAAPTSPGGTRRSSTASPATCCRRSSTTTGPATSQSRPSARTAG